MEDPKKQPDADKPTAPPAPSALTTYENQLIAYFKSSVFQDDRHDICCCGSGHNIIFEDIARILSVTFNDQETYRLFRIKEINLRSIYAKYVPSTWHWCRACCDYLNRVGQIVIYNGTGFTHCMATKLITNDKFPTCINKMIIEMQNYIAEKMSCKKTGVYSLPTTVGGVWPHFACFAPPIGFGNCTSKDQLKEFYRIIKRMISAWRPLRELLIRPGNRPGMITTEILNIVESNVATSSRACGILTYLMNAIDTTKSEMEVEIAIRKVMNAEIIYYLPDDREYTRKLADYRKDNFMNMVMNERKEVFGFNCMQMQTNMCNNGMLGCVRDIICELYEPTDSSPITTLTCEQITKIRDRLPPHIKEAHLQHYKTATESDAQTANVIREIESVHGAGYLSCVPGARHLTISEFAKRHTGVIMCENKSYGYSKNDEKIQISMTSFVSLIRRLVCTPLLNYCVRVLVPGRNMHVYAITDYTCKELMRKDYPTFWYYLVNPVPARTLSITGDQFHEVTFIGSLPSQELNDNTLNWLVGIKGARMETKNLCIFDDFFSSNVPRTHYRYLGQQGSQVSGVAEQACGVSISANNDENALPHEFIYHFDIRTDDGKLSFVIDTRRPDYCSKQISVDAAFDKLVPKSRMQRLQSAIVATTASASSAAAAAAAALPTVDECRVCMDHPKNHILLPCGHQCVCGECASLLKGKGDTCPICRSAISGYNRVFNA